MVSKPRISFPSAFARSAQFEGKTLGFPLRAHPQLLFYRKDLIPEPPKSWEEVIEVAEMFRGSIGGSCSPDRDFPTFLEWHSNGDLDLEALVTERYSIDQINEATAALEEGKIAGRAILEFEH